MAFLIVTSALNVSHFPISVILHLYFLRPFAENIQRFGKIFDLEHSLFCVALFKGTFDLVLTVDVHGLVVFIALCVVTIIIFKRMT